MHLGFYVCLLAALVVGRTRAESAEVAVVRSAVRDWVECGLASRPTGCLEERTLREVRELNSELEQELGLGAVRDAKALEEAGPEAGEAEPLELENRELVKKIQERKAEPRGILDEIGDLVSYVAYKFLNPFTGAAGDEEDSVKAGDQEDGKVAVEERGHKKKELKKKNKQLKLILLLMLLKNKIKMFVNKAQFLVQLKFLLVATVNMLANVIRLWIELKKKHKPNKVVYYESAHHQHHYDHEHLHDHDDHDHGHYSHPGSYSHHAHHEEEDYGGGPWPWSRSYIEKQGDHAYQTVHPYRRYPGGQSVVYYHQRPLR